jgi:Tfp pilus assembly pilus retraction ATPase PilT
MERSKGKSEDQEVKEALGQSGDRPEEYITDWYLPERDPLAGFFYPGPMEIRRFPSIYDMASGLLERSIAKTKDGYEEFVVRAGNVSYRGHKIDSVDGYIYTLRRMPTMIPRLEQLGMPSPIQSIMMDSHLNRGGLLLVCGETGNGKSTTCASVVKDRMLKHGSFCLTVEDPPEMPLHGIHGKGRCIQTEVRSGNFAEAMRGAMRCYPSVNGSMLYVGETRDSETAAEVLTIATNGHLVLTTIHAQDVQSALHRFLILAKARTSEEDARNAMGSVFRLALHQRLEAQSAGSQAGKKKLKLQFLISQDRTSPVASRIRKGEIDALASDIQQQKMVLDAQGMDGLKNLWR